MGERRYLLDNADAGAAPRLEALAAAFDPDTFRRLDALGVGPGWRCWEVGAGGTSVVRWLAGRAGTSGRVLATDLDVSWVAAAGAGIEVRRHDVAADDLPDGPFDLVHARLVLVHVAERERALRAMVASLAPGGWLVVEDADAALQPLTCPDPATPDEELANKIRTGFRALMAHQGADLAFGRTLPRRLRGAGLTAVAAEGYFPLALRASSDLEVATVVMIRDRLVEQGVATPAEVERHLENVARGRIDVAQPPMISAWGARP